MTSRFFRISTAAALLMAGTAAAQAHSAGEVFDILQDKGYTAIHFTDSTGPNYMANACRAGVRYHFHVNNYGRITQRREIGDCGHRARYNRRDDDTGDFRRDRRWRSHDSEYRRWGWRRLRSANY